MLTNDDDVNKDHTTCGMLEEEEFAYNSMKYIYQHLYHGIPYEPNKGNAIKNYKLIDIVIFKVPVVYCFWQSDVLQFNKEEVVLLTQYRISRATTIKNVGKQKFTTPDSESGLEQA